MAFSWLKKIVTAPVKMVGAVVKKVSPVVKAVRPVLEPIVKPVYESVVPQPIRQVIKKAHRIVRTAAPVAKLFKKKKGHEMSEFQKRLSDAIEAALALVGKSGIDLAVSAGLVMQQIMALAILVRGMDRQQLVEEGMAAMDGMIGTEATALIGPTGKLVQLDIPHLDDEMLYDLILDGARSMLKDALAEPTPPAPPE